MCKNKPGSGSTSWNAAVVVSRNYICAFILRVSTPCGDAEVKNGVRICNNASAAHTPVTSLHASELGTFSCFSIKRSQSRCGVFTFLRKNDVLPSQQTLHLSDWKWGLQLCSQLWWLWSSWRWASDDLWLGTEQQDTSLCRRRHPKAGGVVKMRNASCASSWKQLDGSIWCGGQWAGWQSPSLSQQFNHTSIKTQHRVLDSIHPSVQSSSGVSIVVYRCRRPADQFSHLGWRMDILMTDHHYSGSGGLFQNEAQVSRNVSYWAIQVRSCWGRNHKDVQQGSLICALSPENWSLKGDELFLLPPSGQKIGKKFRCCRLELTDGW